MAASIRPLPRAWSHVVRFEVARPANTSAGTPKGQLTRAHTTAAVQWMPPTPGRSGIGPADLGPFGGCGGPVG